MIDIARIDAWALRAPIETPVRTSFGTMADRPAVFVRIEDPDGAFGWGEIFANWPAAGAEHRVNLLIRDIAPMVLGKMFRDAAELSNYLETETRIRALQCGEPGPFRQVIAGIDIACWDMLARRQGMPVRLMLNPDAAACVPVYASGIAIDSAAALVDRSRTTGFSAFKIKVGFDGQRDADALARLKQMLAPGERLFADANQAFDGDTAACFLTSVDPLGLGWLEEPIAADAPRQDWQSLARTAATPLAGGENIAGDAAFAEALEVGALKVIQPDVAKWGGFSGCQRVARAAVAAGRMFCPHFLGGGIGLAASAHLLAAVGGPGLLEVDVNPNPLRDAFCPAIDKQAGGTLRIDARTGLGIQELPDELAGFVTLHRHTTLAAL